MKILILNGSPHRSGCTMSLIDSFVKGAREAGHAIERYDCAMLKIHGCTACEHCSNGLHPCVFNDDMTEILQHLQTCDMVVFATPVYYYGPTAQIKAALDRFYSIDNWLREHPKKAALLTVAGDADEKVFAGVLGTYEGNLQYLHWQDCGRITAAGCLTVEDLRKTSYQEDAYQLGRQL